MKIGWRNQNPNLAQPLCSRAQSVILRRSFDRAYQALSNIQGGRTIILSFIFSSRVGPVSPGLGLLARSLQVAVVAAGRSLT